MWGQRRPRSPGRARPGGRGGSPYIAEGQFEGPRREPEWGNDLASQVENLRKPGAHLTVIAVDADSRAAMGTNRMDPATRNPAALVGHDQGKQQASRVTRPDEVPL